MLSMPTRGGWSAWLFWAAMIMGVVAAFGTVVIIILV